MKLNYNNDINIKKLIEIFSYYSFISKKIIFTQSPFNYSKMTTPTEVNSNEKKNQYNKH